MDFKTFLRNYSRYFLVVFNLFFVITGFTLISLGIGARAYYNNFDKLLDNKYMYLSDSLIVVGVLIFLISFFGCYGALRENACLTTTFSTLLIIIFCLEVFVGIAGFLLKNRTEEVLSNSLKETLKEYNAPGFNETTILWDEIQENFHCCGVNNASDWRNINTTHNAPPTVCCDVPPGHFGPFDCTEAIAYPEGCLTKFGEYVEDHVSTIQSVGISFALLQLSCIFAAFYLAKQIRSDYETV